MKKYLIIAIFLLTAKTAFGHSYFIARYELVEEENCQLWTLTLDKDDFLAATECGEELTADCVESYLRQHLALEVNDEKVRYFYSNHEIEKELIRIRLDLDQLFDSVEKIGVYNDVLLEENPDQENLVSAHLNGEKVTYRMHKDRIRILME